MDISSCNPINSQVLRLFINADIVARDKNGNPVLLVDIKTSTKDPQINTKITDLLAQAHGNIPFGMLADIEKISIFKWGTEHWLEPICVLTTADALSNYEPEFRKKRIFYDYFVSLMEAWLSDLAYQWQSSHPPFLEEIKKIGLLEKLDHGINEQEVDVVEVNLS
jgi:hypothetical protein